MSSTLYPASDVVSPLEQPISAPENDWTLKDQVLTGDHPVRLDEDKIPCGVGCSNGLPQWMWIVDALGFHPVWCMLPKAMDLEWLRPAYPKIVFITELQYCPHLPAVFCDARPLEVVTK